MKWIDHKQTLSRIAATIQDCLASTTPSHVDGPFYSIRFSFDGGELSTHLANPATAAVVHHGSLPPSGSASTFKLFDEHLSLFTTADRRIRSLTRQEIKDILEGKITDWSMLGIHGRGGAIELAGHGDPLHLKSFFALVRTTLGVENLRSDVILHDNYQRLGAHASANDCLVFGLRWTHAAAIDLCPITIEGAQPWDAWSRDGIPSQPITLVVPSTVDNEDAQQISAYLSAVLVRLEQDLEGFDRLSLRWRSTAHDASAEATWAGIAGLAF